MGKLSDTMRVWPGDRIVIVQVPERDAMAAKVAELEAELERLKCGLVVMAANFLDDEETEASEDLVDRVVEQTLREVDAQKAISREVVNALYPEEGETDGR